MTSACTRCGKCAEVCPMPARTDVDNSQPVQLISAVIDRLTDGANPSNAQAEHWAGVCCGSGFCIKACPEDLNPRFLLAMVRRAASKVSKTLHDRRAGGRIEFKKMSRGVRVLSRLQMPPEVLNRLSPSSHPETERAPDVVFYTGCNLLKTPHIGLLCLDVLDVLELRYEVHGGPSNCCGIHQTRSGDDENGVRQSMTTIDKLTRSEPGEILSWCPTCQIQFGESMFPIRVASSDSTPQGPVDMTMFPVFLQRNLDRLRPYLKFPVPKRVALHEHPGSEGVTEAVAAVLSEIPELEVVTLPVARIGYALSSLSPIARQRAALIAEELTAAEAAGVDVLAGIYHSDHREIIAHHPYWPFDVVNYMELIGQSIGISHIDTFKRLKTMRDVDSIVRECMPLIEQHGLDLNEVRQVIESDMLGEQILPVDREHHVAILAARNASRRCQLKRKASRN
ncbi:MAG: (Fe-S)-binding protein [Burkholderiaceae bacterium]